MTDRLRHFAHQPPRALRDLDEVRAGLRQLLGEGAREHRIGIGVVIGKPVQRRLPRPRREDREHAFRQLRHRRQSTAAGDCTRAGAFERIVAAGIEHQDGGAHLAVLHPLDDAVGEDRGVTHQLFLAFGGRRHVGRQQEILAGDFEAVAGIEEERGVARIDRLVERQQGLAERLPVLVLRHHHREAELLQRIAHGAGVVDRLLQLGHVPVVVVADHKRDALFGISGRGEGRDATCKTRHREQSWKANPSSNFPSARMVLFGPCEAASCHSRHRNAHGSTAPVDRNTAARFDGQMTVFALICAKTLSFFDHTGRSQIDFGHFDPMFALNAALDRNAIP